MAQISFGVPPIAPGSSLRKNSKGCTQRLSSSFRSSGVCSRSRSGGSRSTCQGSIDRQA